VPGAVDTSYNVISPLATGLVDRAIYESNVAINVTQLNIAEARGLAFSAAAGCGSGTDAATAACLRNLTAAQIIALAGQPSGNSAYVQGVMVDGTILPEQPLAAWKSGAFAHVPMMNGRVADEQNFTLAIAQYFKPGRPPFTAADYAAGITTAFGPGTPPLAPNPAPPGVPYPANTAALVLAEYPTSGNVATMFPASPPSPQLAWDAAITDMGSCATRHINKILGPQVPYAYQFDDRTAPFYFPKMLLFTSLAYHTSDIQYLFPTYHGGPAPPAVGYPPLKLNGQQTDLSNRARTSLDAVRVDRQSERTREQSLADLHVAAELSRLSVAEHSKSIDVHGYPICCESSLRCIWILARVGRHSALHLRPGLLGLWKRKSSG
jgi:para-nitrobenzyl esterase